MNEDQNQKRNRRKLYVGIFLLIFSVALFVMYLLCWEIRCLIIGIPAAIFGFHYVQASMMEAEVLRWTFGFWVGSCLLFGGAVKLAQFQADQRYSLPAVVSAPQDEPTQKAKFSNTIDQSIFACSYQTISDRKFENQGY